jgi:hypothetical protein
MRGERIRRDGEVETGEERRGSGGREMTCLGGAKREVGSSALSGWFERCFFGWSKCEDEYDEIPLGTGETQ